jgi:hypothetical protein
MGERIMKVSLSQFVVVVLPFLLACGSSSNSGDNSGFSSQPQGNFSLGQELPPSDTSRYTVGCVTPGEPSSQSQIDLRLRVGTVFTESVKYGSNSAPSMSGLVEETVQGVTAASLLSGFRVLSVSGVDSVQPGWTTAKSCTMPSTGAMTCQYNPPFPTITLPNSNCVIDPTGGTNKVYSGSFTTTNGVKVNVYKLVYTLDGNITCGGTAVGQGQLEVSSIVSNDVPSLQSSEFCGGVPVFASASLKGPDSRPIFGVSFEVLALQ